MSVEFTFAQTAPPQALFEVMCLIEESIEKIGFLTSREFCKVDIDERGVFEEVDDCIVTGHCFRDVAADMQGWAGLANEFYCEEYTVYFLIGNYDGQFLNAFMDVSAKVLDRIALEHEGNSFMRLAATVAACMKSVGGFGTYELAFEPVSPEDVVPYILENPKEVPSLLGLISYAHADESEVHKLAGDTYEVVFSTSGFYLLEHQDFRS